MMNLNLNLNLNPHRSWITPLVIGAFLISAVTGILMFFHLNSMLNKVVHEWLSWVMVIGVGLHVLLNVHAFKRYFKQNTGRWVMGGLAALLAFSFIPVGGSGSDPMFAPPVRALAQAPISVLAQVAGTTTESVRAQLQAAGHQVTSDQQTVKDLVGTDLRTQIEVLGKVLDTVPGS